MGRYNRHNRKVAVTEMTYLDCREIKTKWMMMMSRHPLWWLLLWMWLVMLLVLVVALSIPSPSTSQDHCLERRMRRRGRKWR